MHDVPKWISAGVPLKPGKGIPTIAFIQLRQMKKLGIARSGLKKVKMSTVLNATTAVELEMLHRAGVPLNMAILKTQSVQYAKTTLVQSGHQISGAVVTGGSKFRVGDLYGPTSFGTPEGLARFENLLAASGISSSDRVLSGFDIELSLSPIQGAK